ncbi:MAG: DUF1559 domain-containing protein [Planctomycetota bacterium]
MAPIPISLFSLPLVLLLGSVLTAPMSGPPLPLDPALSAVAPSECLLYASSAGVATAESQSPNQTEQLYAKPEVRAFIKGLRDQLIVGMQRTAQGDRTGQIITAELPKLLGALLHRPLALFVEDLTLSDDQLEMRAALVLNAGDRRGELESSISNLVDLALEQGLPIGSMQHQGSTWNVMRMSMQVPEIRWGWHKDYFIFAVGDGVADDTIDRLTRGDAPAWLDALRDGDTIVRESTLCHVDIEGLLSRLQPQLQREQVWPILEKLGLTSLQSFERRAGFDRLGCTSQAKLKIEGQRQGLLAFILDRQLSDNDLRLIPKRVMIAAAVRFDLADAWKNMLRLGEEFDPRGVEMVETNVDLVEEKLGFHLEDDLIGSLDDVWTAYMPEGDLMSAWVGSALAVKVKDAPRLRVAIEALVNNARAKLPQGDTGLQLSDADYEGQTIYTARFVGQPIPISPAWCVTDDWCFFGLSPQTVRDLISRDDKPSFTEIDEVADVFASRDAPTALVYVDTPNLVRAAYPFVQMGASMLAPQLKRQGIDVDPSILPSSHAIVPHLRPFVGTMIDTAAGPELRSQHALPDGNGAMALLPLTFVWGRSVSVSPATAGSRNLNNMKQIALAFHNYADVHGKFPANIYDDDGNALLSWRVQLLPYLEQQALYDRFRLDESWDSEHNQPWSEVVLEVFSTPGGPTDGRTCYLALAGEETLFPGNEELTFRDVTDGTSNTIMFVEASPDQAVSWSKPQDLEFDSTRPMRGIAGNPRGRFGMAMSDGSCRTVSIPFEEETMQRLATRAGGEVVGAP